VSLSNFSSRRFACVCLVYRHACTLCVCFALIYEPDYWQRY